MVLENRSDLETTLKLTQEILKLQANDDRLGPHVPCVRRGWWGKTE